MNTEPALVLVVDDIETNRDLLTRRVQRQGYAVMEAASGQAALDLLVTYPFDLILCDVSMPEMDGYQVLARLKADINLRHIPVIMVSAMTELESVVRCIELGAEDYLFKPFNPTILKARVNASLNKKRLHDIEKAHFLQLRAEREKVEEQRQQLARANAEIVALNKRLKAENHRMSTELDVARRIQQMVLPRSEEIQHLPGLEVAAYMQPADEVGGDYYDILCDGAAVHIGIGDVTGHGLESGVVMLMAQTAVRTLIENGETRPSQLLNTVNRIIYENTRRMRSPKNMTLAFLRYTAGQVVCSGQHEEIAILRANGELECLDTLDLGFPLGLEPDITPFLAEQTFTLQPNDTVVLYTDGITEAVNSQNQQYGIARFHETLQQHYQAPVAVLQAAILAHLRHHVGEHKIFDDITLLVLRHVAA